MNEHLQAGRELDVLIAEKVMGWKLTPRREILRPGYGHYDGPAVWVRLVDGEPMANENHFSPSRDIAEAWAVWERITTQRPDLALARKQPGEPWAEWYVLQDQGEGWYIFGGGRDSCEAETAPLVICRAALEVVSGVPTPQEQPQ